MFLIAPQFRRNTTRKLPQTSKPENLLLFWFSHVGKRPNKKALFKSWKLRAFLLLPFSAEAFSEVITINKRVLCYSKAVWAASLEMRTITAETKTYWLRPRTFVQVHHLIWHYNTRKNTFTATEVSLDESFVALACDVVKTRHKEELGGPTVGNTELIASR